MHQHHIEPSLVQIYCLHYFNINPSLLFNSMYSFTIMISLQSQYVSRRKNYVQLFHLASTKVLQLCCSSLLMNPWSDDFASCLDLDYCFTHVRFYCSSSKDTTPGTWHSVMWTDLNLMFLPTDEADLPSEESHHHLRHRRHVPQGPLHSLPNRPCSLTIISHSSWTKGLKEVSYGSR